MKISNRVLMNLRRIFSASLLGMLVLSALGAAGPDGGGDEDAGPDNRGGTHHRFPDATGTIETFTTSGAIDTDNPFFQSLGSNGRACVSCHQASDAWTITPPHVQARFEASRGHDPLFRLNDGANCSNLDVSTLPARRSAYSLLLNKGLIRIAMPVPANAEFSVVSIDDPYHCSTPTELSMYRRPLPTANIKFLATVMWDGRETVPGQTIAADLKTQASHATTGHAQATVPPTDEQLDQIVRFQLGLFAAQSKDQAAGDLTGDGARGGPRSLSQQEFFIGINDPLGLNPFGTPFNPEAFDVFENWENIGRHRHGERAEARESVARGERIFNTRTIPIADVPGLNGPNDKLAHVTIPGTCTTCHDSPNVGNHSVSAPLDIGINAAARRTHDLPLFTLRCNATAATVQTLDPGRAMVTGKCADIGKVKGPILRGLAARAPYFHNGSAVTLMDTVNFYDGRFNLGLSDQDKEDLVAFLRSL